MELDWNKIDSEIRTLPPWKNLPSHFQKARDCAPWQLWVDKYAAPYAFATDEAIAKLKNQDSKFKHPAGKTSVLHAASLLAKQPIQIKRLTEAITARKSLSAKLAKSHGPRFCSVRMKLESRLLLHLGRSNPLENIGIYADLPTGLPLVSGPSLKGMLSTWACWEANQDQETGEFKTGEGMETTRKLFPTMGTPLHASRILGDNSSSGSTHAGAIIFLGGFPEAVPTIGLDIVTPHPDNGRGQITPNAFLCVEKGGIWNFGFWSVPANPHATDDLITTRTWLVEALEYYGLGAKTAAGYGRFTPVKS